MKKYIAVILFLLIYFPEISWGQIPYSACFTVDNKRGCVPFTIHLKNCSKAHDIPPRYHYDLVHFPAFSDIIQDSVYTYTTPGVYVIEQSVNNGALFGVVVSTTDTVVALGKPAPIFSIQVCENEVINVDITDTNYDSFILDYGDGTVSPPIAKGLYTHTYIGAGALNPKTISVTGQYNVCSGASATKTITPISSLTMPDVLDLTVTNQSTSGSIDLRFNGIKDRLYQIEFKTNNGAYSTISNMTASFTGIITQSFSGLNTQANTYTFRIENVDSCMETSASSAEIASIIIAPSILNGFNKVVFVSNGGLVFNVFNLYRNAALLKANTASPYNDNAVICGTDYCYQITGALPTTNLASGTNLMSYSGNSCIKAAYTGVAPTITNINSTVEGNSTKVVWDKPVLNVAVPAISFYTIYRQNGAPYSNYGSSNSNSYIDNGVSASNQSYCYEVNYKDACSNIAAISLNTCTVNLTVNRIDETNTLTWTSYTGYQSGIKEYVIENLDGNENVVISKSVGLTNTYTEIADPSLSQIIYRIKVVSVGVENLVSYSNIVTFDLTPKLYMPNVFTPNGDGDNDVLEVKGKYYKSLKMTILNKWGEVVFISEDASIGWDGNYKGQPASVDSYGYHVVALDNSGKEISLKGVVSLLR